MWIEGKTIGKGGDREVGIFPFVVWTKTTTIPLSGWERLRRIKTGLETVIVEVVRELIG